MIRIELYDCYFALPLGKKESPSARFFDKRGESPLKWPLAKRETPVFQRRFGRASCRSPARMITRSTSSLTIVALLESSRNPPSFVGGVTPWVF